MKEAVFVTQLLEGTNMGFVQKLASRNPRSKEGHGRYCPTCNNLLKRMDPVIPKLTWKYIFNLKNWK